MECRDTNGLPIEQMRLLPWPRAHAHSAPKISRLLYINLEEDEERREFMEQQAEALGLSATRVKAVTEDEAKSDPRFHIYRKNGYSLESFLPQLFTGGRVHLQAILFSHLE